MTSDLQAWLASTGITPSGNLTALQRGLGSNEIWKLEPGAGEPPLVVRLFGIGSHPAANRENAAMRAAHTAGIPVPEIVATGTMAGRPVMVTTFASGTLGKLVISIP